MSTTPLDTVPESICFPNEELKTLSFWREVGAFETSNNPIIANECLRFRLNSGLPRYTFYDGPPFATGLPHYGHILAGNIKDVVTRWAHMDGHSVERRFGWDCHGLPVEFEVDRLLDIKGPQDVLAMGIDKYNEQCRSIVMRFSDRWQVLNSVEECMTEMVYCVPSVRVPTPIHSQETVQRMGRWIDFDRDYKTMYPWFMESVWWVFSQLFTKGLVYRGVKVMPFSTGCSTPLSNFEAGQNYKDVVDPTVMVSFELDDCPADQVLHLVAWTTTPWTLPSNLALCVHPDLDYVAVRDAISNKLLVMLESRLSELYKNSDQYQIDRRFKGCELKNRTYKPLFPFFAHLKQSTGAFRVLNGTFITTDQGTGVVHQAPYFGEIDYQCCLDNGIISKSMEMICPVDETGKFTEQVSYWQGLYVKDADKAIIKKLKEQGSLVQTSSVKHSYPFCWRSDTPLLYKAVPSWFIRVEALVPRLLANNAKTHCVDRLTIPSKTGRGVLHRVSEVFDCWFESGSMPYAQVHYPFENRRQFEENFPADFVAEGIDQTRGWFYTLLVLSTALFDRPPFKNLICNGLVLASDGTKMSKRKQNYPDPMLVVEKYGADALRLYLINSPVVRGENLRFREEGVKDVIKDVLLPWFNAYRFLVQNVQRWEQDTADRFTVQLVGSDNVMDRWILSFTNSLVRFVRNEMKVYHLYAVVPPLVRFFDTLTNWYVRMNRRRIKGEAGASDWVASLSSLYHVLVQIVRLTAPFTPFLSEYMWQNLRHLLGSEGSEQSVHYTRLPQVEEELIDEDVERRVKAMQTVVDLVRVIRDRKGIALKYPLSEMVVIQRDSQFLDDVKSLQEYVLNEVNVQKLTLTDDKRRWGVRLKAEPNFRSLGARLKGAQKKVVTQLKTQTSEEQLNEFLRTGTITICGHELNRNDLRVDYAIDTDRCDDRYEAHSDAQTVILLDTNSNEQLLREGLIRELISRVQKLRKKAQLSLGDSASVHCLIQPQNCPLNVTLNSHRTVVEMATGTPLIVDNGPPLDAKVLANDVSTVGDANLSLTLLIISEHNVTLHHRHMSHVINLDTHHQLDYQNLIYETCILFSLWSSRSVWFTVDSLNGQKLSPKTPLSSLSGRQLFVHSK